MNSRHLTSVYVVDDLPAMRERLCALVGEVSNTEVVGTAGTPADAIAGVLEMRPDCVLLDYQLEGGTGLDVLRAVHPKAPEVVFVVLTNNALPQYRRACFAAGAQHFLDKATEFDQVRDLIRQAGATRN
jgi:DNA-binding NarL/FixJ family response regulator